MIALLLFLILLAILLPILGRLIGIILCIALLMYLQPQWFGRERNDAPAQIAQTIAPEPEIVPAYKRPEYRRHSDDVFNPAARPMR